MAEGEAKYMKDGGKGKTANQVWLRRPVCFDEGVVGAELGKMVRILRTCYHFSLTTPKKFMTRPIK